MVRHFICGSCEIGKDEMVEPLEELCDGVKTVKGFSIWGIR